MQLKPDSTVPGLWRREPSLVAGVHALIIGISEYPYLEDGSAVVSERLSNSGGLGQLEVCAKTAARFFDLLTSIGEIAGAPITTCRLLLSPRPDEREEVNSLSCNHYASADFEGLRTAIVNWGDDLYAGGRTTEPNVALFFFSGHGVEHTASPAILARDIFKQNAAGGGANRAFAVESLSRAVKTFGIDRALFFVDACRDAPIIAQLLNIVGEAPLKPVSGSNRRPDAVVCLQSTASGLKSYQHEQDPATIFGQAVLEALEGPPPSYRPYDTTTEPWRLVFQSLEAHVKGRVRDLLSKHTTTLLQPVEPYGNPYNGSMLVAHKYAPTLPSRSGDSPLSEMPPVGFTHIASSVDTQAQNIMKDFRSTTADQIRQWREQNPRTSSVSDLSNFGLMHQVFGHETITMPWQETMRLLDPETNGPIANGVVRLMAGHREERESRLTAWLDLLIDRGPGSSVWMSVGGRPGEPCYAVILPRDLHTPIPVRLDVTYENTLNGYVLKDLSARIADPSETTTPMPVTWSALWLAQRTEAFSDLASAGRSIGDFVLLENILDDKTSSPVAAAIAAATLLRCGALDYLHDWPRNLANWFEWLPDGPVLWAETLIRRFDAGQLDPSRAQSPFAQGLNRIEFGDSHPTSHSRERCPHRSSNFLCDVGGSRTASAQSDS